MIYKNRRVETDYTWEELLDEMLEKIDCDSVKVFDKNEREIFLGELVGRITFSTIKAVCCQRDLDCLSMAYRVMEEID